MKKLSTYQRDGLKDLIRSKHFLLLWSMRIRKTLPVIRFVKIKNMYPLLISCPYSAIYEWLSQLIDDGINQKNIVNISTSRDKNSRKKMLSKEAKIYIMNHDAYRSVPEIGRMNFKCMIMDEIHILRNPKSRITKFYINNFRTIQHRIGLTGTWLTENELDLFNLFKFLDYSFTYPYSTYWQCRLKLFVQDKFKWVLKPSGKKYFSNLLSKYSSVLDYAEAGINDTLNEIVRTVRITKESYSIYTDLIKKYILEDNEVQKSTMFSVVNYIWIRQFLSGFVENRLVNSAKFHELQILLNTEFKNMKVVIWCFYDEEIYYLSKELNCIYVNGKLDKHEAQRRIKRFQYGDDNRIIINCRRTEGMKLSNGDVEVYYTIPESRVIINQSKRRIFDIDQKQIKPCIYLITENTLEESILKSHRYNTSCYREIINHFNQIKGVTK